MDIELPEGAVEAGRRRVRHRPRPDPRRGRAASSRCAGSIVQTMNDFVESGLLWREVVGQRFRARALPTEADIDAALERAPDPAAGDADPRRDRAALRGARRGRDPGARRRPLPPALPRRELRRRSPRSTAAAARPSAAASSMRCRPTACPAAFRTQVLLLSPGQVTRPIPISGGLALVKLVSIKREMLPRDPRGRDPRRPRGAPPAAVQRAHQQLRAGLSPGASRRRADRRAMIPPVALTLGDPAGIGGEIALRAWAALARTGAFFLIGDRGHMAGARPPPRRPRRRDRRAAGAAAAALPRGLPVLHHPLPRPAPPGAPDPANAAAVVAIIERGVELVRGGARAGALHQPDPQEGAEGRRRLRLSRPHRVPRPPLAARPAGDDARRARRSASCR